jgi:hypothetical protein
MDREMEGFVRCKERLKVMVGQDMRKDRLCDGGVEEIIE